MSVFQGRMCSLPDLLVDADAHVFHTPDRTISRFARSIPRCASRASIVLSVVMFTVWLIVVPNPRILSAAFARASVRALFETVDMYSSADVVPAPGRVAEGTDSDPLW